MDIYVFLKIQLDLCIYIPFLVPDLFVIATDCLYKRRNCSCFRSISRYLAKLYGCNMHYPISTGSDLTETCDVPNSSNTLCYAGTLSKNLDTFWPYCHTIILTHLLITGCRTYTDRTSSRQQPNHGSAANPIRRKWACLGGNGLKTRPFSGRQPLWYEAVLTVELSWARSIVNTRCCHYWSS